MHVYSWRLGFWHHFTLYLFCYVETSCNNPAITHHFAFLEKFVFGAMRQFDVMEQAIEQAMKQTGSTLIYLNPNRHGYI